jgi:Zn-dependent membrane protease YugP
MAAYAVDRIAKGVAAVLSAAAWTYVAAFVTSLVTLLYYVSMISGRRS